MEEMFGRKIIALCVLFFFISCQANIKRDKPVVNACKASTLCKNDDVMDTCIQVVSECDFPKDVSYIHLICDGDTLDTFSLFNLYAKPELNMINDQFLEVKYMPKGGMKRNAVSIFYLKHFKIYRLVEFYTFEKFTDTNFAKASQYELIGSYIMKGDSIFFSQEVWEEEQLRSRVDTTVLIDDLKEGRVIVSPYID